jgi:flagellar basal body-associated protein FliL
MQMLFRLISKLTLIVISAPIAYYGYFLTSNIIMPNYMELLERDILESRSIEKQGRLRRPKLIGSDSKIYRVKDIMSNPYKENNFEDLVRFTLSIETQDDSVLIELKNRHSQLQDMMVNYVKTHDFDHMSMVEYNELALSGIVQTINKEILTRGYIDTVYIENFTFN